MRRPGESSRIYTINDSLRLMKNRQINNVDSHTEKNRNHHKCEAQENSQIIFQGNSLLSQHHGSVDTVTSRLDSCISRFLSRNIRAPKTELIMPVGLYLTIILCIRVLSLILKNRNEKRRLNSLLKFLEWYISKIHFS